MRKMTEESAVKVCVRVRPLIEREESAESTEPVQVYWKSNSKSIHLIDDGNSNKSFSFDRVFAAEETTNQLYQGIAKPLVVSSVEGYNGTIFAYGQTSSGKTFTMMGSDLIPGVIPLAVEDVFQTIKNCPKKEFLLRVSYMEIYNETVTDLLVDSWKRKPLEVRETINKNIYVADLTEELVTNPEQALAWIRKGEKNRHYGKTKMNQRSSRSHTIFRMILESRERSDPASGENADGAIIVSHLNLVDLAGSERASQTGAEGTRFKEGCNINRSLFTLGQVIKKLTDESQKGFTNYRDSKLTRILQNSLGGNAKTVIICTITPVALDETLSTLQFASTAKKMKNDPHVTEVSDDGALLKRYRNEIVDLKRRLHEVSSVTHTTATEKEFLAQLLQEKDQLQREQEDRIKNLTKLIITSSTLVPVHKMPKRRVTWGGKMIRLARPSVCGSSDLSFADPVTRKRRADRSCLTELGEEDESFDSHWDIPDEPSDEMEINQSCVTVRSFGDSPKDFVSPDRMHDLSGKVSNLEQQLEIETHQKKEALEKAQTLDGKVAELELQLQTEAQQKQEFLEKIQTVEQRAAKLELQLQLQTEALEKQETLEKIPIAEERMAELERQLQTEAEQKKETLEKIKMAEERVAELELQLQLQAEALERHEILEKTPIAEERIAELELQLQTEAQQKNETLEKIQIAEERVAELELQLQMQTEAQQKHETLEKIQIAEERVAELELQLQTEAQQKHEATEKVEMLEFRVADLERQLEEQSHIPSETEQMRREFAETIQLCETLASEKDTVVGERDYLKEELGMFIEQIQSLEKANAAMSQELQEKRETDEFESLEEEFRKEHESKLKNELSSLKKAVESSELQCLELQNKLKTLTEELKKKSDFAEELQCMSGKDLVQEVAKLRRSLDDAEGLSRDTKKEWAFLRSENIALEERVVTLSVNHDKLDNEVNSLRYQLETEKSRFRKMQTDLQKELNVVFDENTKLTTLLDGKVPKNLIDSVELERTVSNLNKELTAAREAEEALRAQLEELSSFQALPEKVDSLTKQVCELTEELCAVQTQRDGLLSSQAQCREEAQQLRDLLQTSQDEVLKIQADFSAAALREKELSEQHADVTQQLDSLRSDLDQSDTEKSQLMATMEEMVYKLQESEQHRASLEEKLNEMQQLIKDLEEKLADSENSRSTEEEISKELQEQVNQLTEELQSVRAEREQNAGAQTSAEELEKLLATVTSVTAERDQLRMDLQENMQMAAETQALLQSLQDDLQEQKQKISDLMKLNEQKESDMLSLTQELQTMRDEKETLLMAGVQSSAEELQSTVASLTEERDQLKMDMQENVEMMIENQEELRAALERNRQQKELIKQLEKTSRHDGPPSEMSPQLEELQTHLKTMTAELESVRAERDGLFSEKEASCQTSTEEMEKLLSRVTSLSEERDQLQETLEGLRQEKQQLKAELEDRMEVVALAHGGFNQPEMLSSELQAHDVTVTQLQQEIEQLQATLQAVSEQKSQLEGDLQQNMEKATETQSLLHSCQQQLQEQNQRNIDLERVNQERQAQLEQQVAETQSLLHSLQEEFQEQKQRSSDHMILCEQKESDLEQQMKTLTEQLESTRAERDALLFEKEAGSQTSTEEMEKLLSRVSSLSEERDQLQETLEGLRQEKQQLKAELEDRMEMMQCEFQQQLSSEPQSLKEEHEEQQLLQIQQLEEQLEKTKEETTQMKSDLQENVELMIENQEELRVSQEKIKVLQDEINMLRSQKAELESNGESAFQSQELQNQIQILTKELESVRAERDGLLSERTADAQTHSEEMEKLLSRVTSLSEERDQLQETLEGLRQEKQQLKAELEDRMETLQAESVQLSLSLQTITEQKKQLEDDLQHNMNEASTTQELLKSVQEELCELKQINSDLQKLSQEKECTLDQQLRSLTEKLEHVEAERDGLLSEKEASCQTSTEEMEKLLSRVTSLSEERDQLQETLEGLRREKQQLKAELEDRMETLQAEIWTLSEKLVSVETERDGLLSEKKASCQTSTEEMEKLLSRVTSLSEERDQLQETLEGLRQEKRQERTELEDRMETLQTKKQQLNQQLQMYTEKLTRTEAEAHASQQLLSKANSTISALQEQLSTRGVKETISSRLQDSTAQLQESFRRFQHFIDTCSKFNSHMDKTLRVEKHPSLIPLPKATMNTYSAVCNLGQQSLQSLGHILAHLQPQAQIYRTLFEELVKKDLAIFEVRRQNDLLQCRVQAPSDSVKDEDFSTLLEHNLTDLLDKRQLYLQKMASILEKLRSNMACLPSELSSEARDRERFKDQLQTAMAKEPNNYSGLDSILSSELERRSAVVHSRKMKLQSIISDHDGQCQELKSLEAQADSQLREEKSKSSTLLQASQGAPLKTELSQQKDNQQLVLQLQQTEEKVKALSVQNNELRDAQIKANNRVSNHKQATQLLQTELQDSRAQVEEKENTIQTLTKKLRESEKNAPPTAVEMENLQKKMFKMEVELTSASDKHQQEIQRMTTLLNEKEHSMRKLKEALRKSQQQGEESFLQGEDLHARLTDPRGGVIKSSVMLEKTKLEEEIKQLRLKITGLESLVSSQQAEISKWKSRAIKLKGKTKNENPSPPCTPTKRGLPMTSDSSNFLNSPKKFLVTPRKVLDSPRKVLESPRKLLDSPKASLLDSPKSRFFDVGGSSELLSRTCPKQFFDNSSLGTIPDAAVGADRKEEWWPQSPKQEDMCKTQ
ncbi:centromere-associated protein E isoform X2 [Sparus aurata]|uniref:centromere-associated protein E isoform X2 n=1 Tax=Sparus aurata TaxID=8175 RepID=UPI0011C13892|nr:centromere-associated protein E isoform X2 [Sparus aurata]